MISVIQLKQIAYVEYGWAKWMHAPVFPCVHLICSSLQILALKWYAICIPKAVKGWLHTSCAICHVASRPICGFWSTERNGGQNKHHCKDSLSALPVVTELVIRQEGMYKYCMWWNHGVDRLDHKSLLVLSRKHCPADMHHAMKNLHSICLMHLTNSLIAGWCLLCIT